MMRRRAKALVISGAAIAKAGCRAPGWNGRRSVERFGSKLLVRKSGLEDHCQTERRLFPLLFSLLLPSVSESELCSLYYGFHAPPLLPTTAVI